MAVRMSLAFRPHGVVVNTPCKPQQQVRVQLRIVHIDVQLGRQDHTSVCVRVNVG